MKERTTQLESLQEKIGVRFKDRWLLNRAFIHPSFANERGDTLEDNQRLEFLGDAVLELSVSQYLFERHRELTEGQMTRIRALAVCETSLARISRGLSLGNYLFLGKGEELTGGREKPSILADTFEALVGGIFIERGLPDASAFVIEHLASTIQSAIRGDLSEDYKTTLQETLQRHSPAPVLYEVIDEMGPDHHKVFRVHVLWKNEVLGEGSGNNKKQAEQRAAKMALEKIRQR